MTVGARAGTNFLLDPTDEIRIGRGMDCDIILTDPLCSRVHAVVVREDEGWWIRDADSRNSTYVNGQKTDEARLAEGTVIRVGSTEFSFHRSDQPPTQASVGGANLTQTIVRNTPVDPHDTGEPRVGRRPLDGLAQDVHDPDAIRRAWARPAAPR